MQMGDMADVGVISTLGNSTYKRLREMIFSGVLAAGDSLQEKRLAERLGVSRTPVREAITRLMSEGLVQRNAGFTPMVRRLSVKDFIEILHVRRLLEVEAAGLAAEAGASDELRQIGTHIGTFRDGAAPTPEQHVLVDDQLHTCVAKLAGSHVLAELIHDLRQKTKIFDMGQLPERFAPGIAEHLEIVDAITKCDVLRSQIAMRTHIDNVRASVIGHLQRLF